MPRVAGVLVLLTALSLGCGVQPYVVMDASTSSGPGQGSDGTGMTDDGGTQDPTSGGHEGDETGSETSEGPEHESTGSGSTSDPDSGTTACFEDECDSDSDSASGGPGGGGEDDTSGSTSGG